jgi:hypothetical protein
VKRFQINVSLMFAVAVLILTGCGLQAPQQQALITSGVTLGAQALANNKTAQGLIDAGQLLCLVGPLVVAPAGINVTGTNADDMAAVCKGLGGIGAGTLAPGQTAASVPVVTAPAVAIKPKS